MIDWNRIDKKYLGKNEKKQLVKKSTEGNTILSGFVYPEVTGEGSVWSLIYCLAYPNFWYAG